MDNQNWPNQGLQRTPAAPSPLNPGVRLLREIEN
jgi:hypothetical protein